MGEDAFEQSEMHDGSPVVRRDKLVSRRMAALLSGTGILRTHPRVATDVRVSEDEPEAEALDEAKGATPGATRSAGEP